MSSKKLKEFNVQVKVDLTTDVTIRAENMADALARAGELDMSDVVEFSGDYIDGSVKVTGLFTID